MARTLRVLFEGAIYHVTIRGVERRALFTDDHDRQRFLSALEQAGDNHQIRLYVFCLMRNHVPLLLETPRANLPAFMHQLQTAYTVYFNRRHRRSGHLMQGRFGATPVQGDEYLLTLSRYIHLNPVCVAALRHAPLEDRVRQLRGFAWSSYRGYAALGKPYAFVAEGPILEQTGKKSKRQRLTYRRFVEAGLAQTDEAFLKVLRGARWGIGDLAFQDRIRDAHADLADHAKRPEDVAFRRRRQPVAPEAVLAAVAAEFGEDRAALRQRRYRCAARAVLAHLLGRHAGMTQRAVATWLAMGTGAAVSAQIKRLRARAGNDPALAAHIAHLSAAIEARGQPTERHRS